MEEMSIYYQLL